MRDQRNRGPADEPPDQDVLEHGLLHLVLARQPAQLHVDEIVRELGEARFLIDDALAALVGNGLLHRTGEFVTATRAAVRFDELGS